MLKTYHIFNGKSITRENPKSIIIQIRCLGRQSILQAAKEKNKCFADGKEIVFFHYVSAEIVNERAVFTETKIRKELKYKMFCVMFLDKAFEQYSTLDRRNRETQEISTRKILKDQSSLLK